MRERIARATLALLASALVFAPSAAQAAVKLFTAQWYTESKGNECKGTLTPNGLPAPICTRTTPDFTMYSVFAIPQGQNCNAHQPRCPLSSTPTSMGKWHPLGGVTPMVPPTVVPNCAPLSTYPAPGPNTRPAKGGTAIGGTMTGWRVPPVYRNPAFFTSGGQPKLTDCTVASTGVWTTTQTRFGADKGRVQKGHPIAGSWNAVPTGTGPLAGFTIPPAPPVGQHQYGIRTTALVGEFASNYPYIYSYTYATLRNDQGAFGPGQGPGSFNHRYTLGTPNSSYGGSVMVKQGKNKFGGTMKMLGAFTTKQCYWLRAGGGRCTFSSPDWRYDAVGAAAYTSSGVVTRGYIAWWSQHPYYRCFGFPYEDCLTVTGSRFPWTTGSVTVTAGARGPHKTVHYAHGYDNRTPTGGNGTIQLVSPILTRWWGYTIYETGGIGILRIKFIPEPQTWAMLVAGAALLGMGYRMRGR
jgi:hypothetical protein